VRILLITFGPIAHPSGGLVVRAHNTAASLTRLGHTVTVVSTNEPDGPPPWRCVELKDRCLPFGSREFTRVVASLRAESDVVFVTSALFLGGLIRAGAFAGTRHVPVIWDTTECETLHYRRLPMTPSVLARRALWRVLEGWTARLTDVTVAISTEEAEHWAQLIPPSASKVAAVPHASVPGPPPSDRPPGATRTKPAVGFIGNAGSKQNEVSVRWIIEVLAPRLGDRAEIVLIGNRTDELAAQLNAPKNVRALGRVVDADALLADVDIALAPSEAAAGVKTKVLHYLALGRLIAATDNAVEGIRDAPGVEVASLEDLPALVERLLTDPETPPQLHTRQSLQATWLERHHGQAVVDEAWAEVLVRARSGPRAGVTVELPDAGTAALREDLDVAAAAAAAKAPPVFIVGCPRSGTTLVQLMIDAHPDFAIPPELEFVAYVGLHPRAQSWSAEEALDRILAYPSYSLLGIEPDAGRSLVRELRPEGTAGVIRALLGCYAAQHGATRWGEKTPVQAFYLDGLDRLFPDALVVHVIRDGRDTAASLAEMPWGPVNVMAAAFTWRHAVAAARSAGRRLGPARYCEVRLEEVVADPEAAARRLCGLLEIDFDPAMLRYHERAETRVMSSHREYHPNVARPPSANLRDWKASLAPSQIHAVETYLRPALIELGYPVPEQRPASRRLVDGAVGAATLARSAPRLAGVVHAMTGRRFPVVERAELVYSTTVRLIRSGGPGRWAPKPGARLPESAGPSGREPASTTALEPPPTP
jgi:hypothetical protein